MSHLGHVLAQMAYLHFIWNLDGPVRGPDGSLGIVEQLNNYKAENVTSKK